MKKSLLLLFFLAGCQDLENAKPVDQTGTPKNPGGLDLKLLAPIGDSANSLIIRVTNKTVLPAVYFACTYFKQPGKERQPLQMWVPLRVPDTLETDYPTFNNGKKLGPKDKYYFVLYEHTPTDSVLILDTELRP